MLNSTSEQIFLPPNIQNYNPNIIQSASKIQKPNLNSSQTLNSFYSKSNNHKKMNAIILTDQNVNSRNVQKALRNTPQIMKTVYNNAYSNINKKIDPNINFAVKFSSAQKIVHPSENLNIANIPNSGVKAEGKKDYTQYNNNNNNKISDELVNNASNYYTPRVDRNNNNKNYRIPHPQSVKKRLADVFNQQANKYNTNYNQYNTQYNMNQSCLNNYNKAVSTLKNSTNNLTDISKLSSSVDNFSLKKRIFEEEPKNNFKLSDFELLEEIGKGAEGVINVARWKKNNKKYALKKIIVSMPESIKKRKQDNAVIKNFIESTGCDTIIKPIASTYLLNEVGFLELYEIIELAETDWEKEILKRKEKKNYYTESELLAIFSKIINTFYLLQKHHITHRDIKPQNILIANGKLKICDFGNARILKRQGVIIQRIRGSELFMSPIVFEGYRAGKQNIRHNAYKSDVFSLGMCFFLAACCSYDGPNVIRLLYDMKAIKKVLNYNLAKRYSEKIINMLWTMLQVEEKKRPDFIELKALYP